jgi:hypothetical protein
MLRITIRTGRLGGGVKAPQTGALPRRSCLHNQCTSTPILDDTSGSHSLQVMPRKHWSSSDHSPRRQGVGGFRDFRGASESGRSKCRKVDASNANIWGPPSNEKYRSRGTIGECREALLPMVEDPTALRIVRMPSFKPKDADVCSRIQAIRRSC